MEKNNVIVHFSDEQRIASVICRENESSEAEAKGHIAEYVTDAKLESVVSNGILKCFYFSY